MGLAGAVVVECNLVHRQEAHVDGYVRVCRYALGEFQPVGRIRGSVGIAGLQPRRNHSYVQAVGEEELDVVKIAGLVLRVFVGIQ